MKNRAFFIILVAIVVLSTMQPSLASAINNSSSSGGPTMGATMTTTSQVLQDIGLWIGGPVCYAIGALVLLAGGVMARKTDDMGDAVFVFTVTIVLLMIVWLCSNGSPAGGGVSGWVGAKI